MILDEIFANRRVQIAQQKKAESLPQIEARAAEYAKGHKTRDFAASLKKGGISGISVIAEVKKASPSKGLIKADFDPVSIARQYEAAGADAVSVLTEETYFKGAAQYLEAVRQAIDLPILRKDFIFDEWQIAQARLIGADAILLIAAMLDTAELRRLREYAERLELAALVETHNETEMKSAIESGAAIIGVNNRNLADFKVDLGTAERLSHLVPSGCVFVAESGITGRADVKRMTGTGADAVLVGETLMRASSIKTALHELKGERDA